MTRNQLQRLKQIEQGIVELTEKVRNLQRGNVEWLTVQEALAKYARSSEQFDLLMEAIQTGKRCVVYRNRIIRLID